MPHPNNCPNCGIHWQSDISMPDTLFNTGRYISTDVAAEVARDYYGWTEENDRRLSANVVGIEDPILYDGVSFWQCTACNTTFDRWTMCPVTKE